MADDSFIWNWNHSLNLQPGGGGTSDASNPDWNAQIAQEEQLRRQEAAIKAAEDYPSASVGSVADKGAPGRSLAQIVGAGKTCQLIVSHIGNDGKIQRLASRRACCLILSFKPLSS